jgi:LysR family glycine cleavage system transcriptional activator
MNPRRLTLSMSLLIAFDATARHPSFTRAAGELALTQSAVSSQVQSLEALLGVPLFRRVNRKLSPTAIGSA